MDSNLILDTHILRQVIASVEAAIADKTTPDYMRATYELELRDLNKKLANLQARVAASPQSSISEVSQQN